MKIDLSRIVKGCLAMAAVAALAGCPDFSKNDSVPTEITRIAAFKCIVPNIETCQGRGAEIPAGTLPPTNEGFQVWVWHPGANTTSWRILWADGFTDNQIHVAQDSVGQGVNLGPILADGIKQMWVRAAIIAVSRDLKDTTVLARDSIGWTFP
jgi:hypothetical protein